MPIKFCPNCNTRYVVDNNVGDYVHTCNSGILARDQDDVLVVGNWEDSDGTSGIKGPQEVMRQGAENNLFGTRANLEDGEIVHTLTARGNTATTHRQNQHDEYINFDSKGLD